MQLLSPRRAAELKNQPGPHGDKALEALKRAFDREWAPGEQVLMAGMLYSLGNIAYDPLAKEQVRELEWLYQQQKKGTFDRLAVGTHLGRIIYGYGRKDEAVDVIGVELAEFQTANNGVLPTSAQQCIKGIIQVLQQEQQPTRGETLLGQQKKPPAKAQQKFFPPEPPNTLYHHALTSNGEVSLGKGQTLYAALEKKLR